MAVLAQQVMSKYNSEARRLQKEKKQSKNNQVGVLETKRSDIWYEWSADASINRSWGME